MAIDKFELKNGLSAIVLWQKSETSGVGEPALVIRTFCNDRITIKQEDREILINRESLKELIDILRKYL